MIGKNWEKKEIDFLIKNYPVKGKIYCSKYLLRGEGSIRKKASELKLKQDIKSNFFKEWQNRARKSKIGKKRPIHSKVMKEKGKRKELWNQNPLVWTKERRKKQSKITKKFIKEHGHTRGMLGKTHSKKNRLLMSKRFKKQWKDPTSAFNSKKYKQAQSDRQSKIMIKRIQNKGTVYSRSLNGWYVINNKRFYFRSSWEVNYARYLEWLLNKGDIIKWEYEPDVFWFEKIKRGVRSYLPDFKITNKNGTFEYHEVKGWMDDKSKTKIKRMKLYYPKIKLIIIEKDSYKSVKQYERMYPEAVKEEKRTVG